MGKGDELIYRGAQPRSPPAAAGPPLYSHCLPQRLPASGKKHLSFSHIHHAQGGNRRMLSAVERYKLLLPGALALYFPRTPAYLRAEREAGLPQKKPRARAKKAGAAAGKSAAGKSKAGAGKKPARPRGKPGKPASTAIYGPA